MAPSHPVPAQVATVLLLTEARYPLLSPDDQPLIAALLRAGCRVQPSVWSDSIPDAETALIRSTWDYTTRRDAFLSALEGLSARMPLWNPLQTVRWNADKRYLLELADGGVRVPPSAVSAAGSGDSLASVMRGLGSDDVVVKPVVGASGVDTWRTDSHGESRWSDAIAERDLLVQAFVPEVVTEGEWSLVFIDGVFSHAVLKQAAPGEFRVQEQYGGASLRRDPPAALLRGAERVLSATAHPWLYARVDGVDVAGAFTLMELELIEPALFFGLAPEAAEALATALIGRL